MLLIVMHDLVIGRSSRSFDLPVGFPLAEGCGCDAGLARHMRGSYPAYVSKYKVEFLGTCEIWSFFPVQMEFDSQGHIPDPDTHRKPC